MAMDASYGTTRTGQPVDSFVLRNKNGLEVRGISYGCRLTHILVPGGAGSPVDILQGFDDLAAYEADTVCHGAFVGRYAGLIEKGRFSLNGQEIQLPQNAGENHLHGIFPHTVFAAEKVGDNSVSLTYTSPEGEDGFPGELWVGVMYTLTDHNELVMDVRAVSTADTVVNFNNHNYYNLEGVESDSIEGQKLWVNSSQFLEAGPGLLPTGRILPVEGGAFDFREEKALGKDLHKDDPQLKLAGGYDHTFPLEKTRPGALSMAAIARDPASGRTLRVYTTQPAVHLYTGNYPNPASTGKSGRPMPPYSGFCLETQHYANSPNQPDFPSTLLEAGDKLHQITVLLLEW